MSIHDRLGLDVLTTRLRTPCCYGSDCDSRPTKIVPMGAKALEEDALVVSARSVGVASEVAARTFQNGFPNTRPKRGHLNPTGHAAVAEVLAHELLTGKPSAVF